MANAPAVPEFEGSRAATPEDLRSLTAISQQAAQTLEQCIELHHVAEIDYLEEGEDREKIRFRPAYIRFNRAQHLVVWGMRVGVDHWAELRLDRIKGVHDTAEVFEPTW
jgi:hypothetical protein